jgi:NAD(P)-dependent dehydrogenase (short-subunit alcohol dehydrogenase family)
VSVGIAGSGSTIARAFRTLLPSGEQVVADRLSDMPADLDRYFVCAGFLAGKTLSEIGLEDAWATWDRNFIAPARFCDRVLRSNPRARICLMGSESGFKGSHDMAYAGAKAALHLYVETKRLEHPGQQLVAISPTIILDTNMTRRRTDKKALEARAAATRHGRWLDAAEVASLAYQALFAATPFLSNTIIRLKEREG